MSQATHLRTVTVPLDELRQFPGNAKRGDVPAILDSLRRNGQYRAIVVREAEGEPLTILAGNHTAQALELHGPGPCNVPVKTATGEQPCGICGGKKWQPSALVGIYSCGDDTARRINLVDNRSAELGSWDRDALAELLSCMDDDLGGTGYTDADVQLLIAPPLSLDELADTYGDPETADFWPVLRLRISPETRDLFRDRTADCPTPDDDGARLTWLLAQEPPEQEPTG